MNSYKNRDVYPEGPNAFPGGHGEFNKAIDDLEAKWQSLIVLPGYGSLFAQVKSIFESKEVHDRVEDLQKTIDNSRMRLSSREDAAEIRKMVLPKMDALLSAMGNEIISDGR